jgi:predicted ester cyclase
VAATDEDNLALVRRVTQLIERERDFTGLHEILAEDFRDHSPSPGFAPDREGFEENARSVYGAFSDLESSSLDMFSAGDKVVERWTEHGTHTGTYLDVPATGRRVTVRAIEIWRIRDCRIVERWAVVDEGDLLRQIGAVNMCTPADIPAD